MQYMSDYEILLYVKRVSTEKGVKLSPSECAFFISLFHYIEENGDFDEEKKLHYVQASCRELSLISGITSSTTVLSALQKFEECSLVVRHFERSFRPLGDGTFALNKGALTYMNLSLFYKA